MKLTVTSLNGDVYNFEVSDDMELMNFKALCELETGISANQQDLFWNGNSLKTNDKPLKDYGLQNGDVLLLQHSRPQYALNDIGQPSSHQPLGPNVPAIDFANLELPGVPGTSSRLPSLNDVSQNPELVRELLLARPHDLAIIKERNPELAAAIQNKDKFAEVFLRQQNEQNKVKKARLELLNRDQFDPEVQKMIAEEIRKENVDNNMETAMEYSPESFGQVVMLYINCKVNGEPVKAFVDSGAQMTIMSSQCAERCNIKHLIDTRWAGIAHGVGTQTILGRVHLGQIQIGDNYLPSSFSILEQQPMDMLLGLDMLRRHQCCIDLKHNKLIIGTTNTETPFLHENELPPSAQPLTYNRHLDPVSREAEDQQLAHALAQSAAEPLEVSSNSPFPESSISAIVTRGYTRKQAIDQLTITNGDVNKALAILIALSLPILPPK